MDYQKSYIDQKLPPLAPPSWIFGVVWPFLYLLILLSYGWIIWRAVRGEVSLLFIAPFVINLIANGLFTYFQFKLKNHILALADILVVLITIVMTIIVTWQNYRVIAYMQLPYLIWVAFATYLQIAITSMNRQGRADRPKENV